ncbi:hypothetical protein JOB18_040583 [Solea senegalensis]|uniref:Uncharacterized protein n=1 Tax=Solea senegalensis TaxID=28829 RepID=A0AAV6RDZ6_SOLSE|nr:hypothetical protein JOB18_040583 [Solea senegalensis]
MKERCSVSRCYDQFSNMSAKEKASRTTGHYRTDYQERCNTLPPTEELFVKNPMVISKGLNGPILTEEKDHCAEKTYGVQTTLSADKNCPAFTTPLP